jgi:GT2 family glycosyltransferase
MDLSVIAVTWNSAALIGDQLASVQHGCGTTSYEQFVVDNNSNDTTVAEVKKFPGVTLIVNADNKGFAAANNLAASRAHGEFLLFLNPDMRVSSGSLDVMVNWMRNHPKVGLASCKLVDENGKLNADALPRRWPGLFDQLAIILKLQHVLPQILNRYLWKGFNADIEQPADTVRGSFMIMRREVYEKLGFAFDPRYYIWFEDVDVCREVTRLGYQVMHTPIISCVDYVGQSFKQRTTLWKQKQFTHSMLTYFKKWEPWYVWMWIALFRPVGIALAWVNDKVKG